MKIFYKIKKCRVCDSKNLKKTIDLSSQYIQGSFLKKNFPLPYQKKIPLKLVICKKCSLLQLQHTTNKKILYKNYWYESSINNTMRDHLRNLVKDLIFFKKNKYENLNLNALDIGCNDGTLLKFYPNNVKKFGIDPSQIIKKIKDKNIFKIRDFFPLKKKKFKKLKIKFDFITSIAMFYDLDNPNKFVRHIKKILKDDGIWVIELSYLLDMIKLNSFDTICHEHLEYYSVNALNYLMKKNKFKIFRIEKNTSNGGSLRCYITHLKNNEFDDPLQSKFIHFLSASEIKKGIKKNYIYNNFYKNITILKKKTNKLINSIIKKNKKIYILGASTKGNTILQFFGINHRLIKFAIERNKQKIGAQTIGSKIKIVGENFIKNNFCEYKLVLPWHFKKEIVLREIPYIKKGGNLIFPLPNLTIVNKKNYLKHV